MTGQGIVQQSTSFGLIQDNRRTTRATSRYQADAQFKMAAADAETDVTMVEVDCTHWFAYPGFAEWYASLSLPVAEEEVEEQK